MNGTSPSEVNHVSVGVDNLWCTRLGWRVERIRCLSILRSVRHRSSSGLVNCSDTELVLVTSLKVSHTKSAFVNGRLRSSHPVDVLLVTTLNGVSSDC